MPFSAAVQLWDLDIVIKENSDIWSTERCLIIKENSAIWSTNVDLSTDTLSRHFFADTCLAAIPTSSITRYTFVYFFAYVRFRIICWLWHLCYTANKKTECLNTSEGGVWGQLASCVHPPHIAYTFTCEFFVYLFVLRAPTVSVFFKAQGPRPV